MVGIFRAPQLLFSVISRVKELMTSEKLTEEDQQFIVNVEEQYKLKLPDVIMDEDNDDDNQQ